MEVIGRSKAKAVIESHLNDSVVYFSDHVKILKCNPYCTGVTYLKEHGVYQWIFQVNDPRDNPITAVFFVTQDEEHLKDTSIAPSSPEEEAARSEAVGGRCIRWVNAAKIPEIPLDSKNTFVGRANTRICLYHLDNQRTEVHFETDITLDFELSFPLNLMPEAILKFTTEAIMSNIMQQATESMLCQVQSDLCCTTAELNASGGTA